MPSAVMPPSAKSRHWTRSTTLTQSIPVHGPTRTAASAPPIRWPLVPAPTGKLSICTAKMNAATRPAIGAVLSSSSLRAPTRATPTQADGDDAGGGGRRGVEEAVGDVHAVSCSVG